MLKFGNQLFHMDLELLNPKIKVTKQNFKFLTVKSQKFKMAAFFKKFSHKCAMIYDLGIIWTFSLGFLASNNIFDTKS